MTRVTDQLLLTDCWTAKWSVLRPMRTCVDHGDLEREWPLWSKQLPPLSQWRHRCFQWGQIGKPQKANKKKSGVFSEIFKFYNTCLIIKFKNKQHLHCVKLNQYIRFWKKNALICELRHCQTFASWVPSINRQKYVCTQEFYWWLLLDATPQTLWLTNKV